LWAYHRVYDNYMLVFLLVALAALYLRTRQRLVGAMLLLVGFTLCFPIRSIESTATYLLHVLIWSVAIVVLGVVATNAQQQQEGYAELVAVSAEA
jgi:uncharacterized membrane protein YczE